MAETTLFRNARVFDGENEAPSEETDVLVRGSTIEGVGPAADGDTTVDGGGRVPMPGPIDAHWRSMINSLPAEAFLGAEIGYIDHLAAREAERTLMRGSTTVRDAGGPISGLKRAIDEGIVAGPRIYPCGAMISQSSGHGDFRMPHEVPRTPMSPLSRVMQVGAARIADGAEGGSARHPRATDARRR
jgi:imidazolonepropionase-like amidohydrolase